jgi:phage terminase large subunit-like protein
MIEMFPHIMAVLIEDKANGSAIITTLRQQIAGIITARVSWKHIDRSVKVEYRYFFT